MSRSWDYDTEAPAATMPPRPRTIGLPAQRGARIGYDPSGRPPLAIPDSCGGCTWLLMTTDPATWRRVKTNPLCRVHGHSSDEKSGAGG
jgi:hypothetical protein